MAQEYSAEIGPGFPWTEVMEALDLADLAVPLSITDEQVLLRWADTPARPGWVNDIAIVHDAQRLLVQIHVGSRDRIAQLLHRIAALVQQRTGEWLEFEEM